MQKTIKIIDILNLIANEEWDKLPKKMKYNEIVYTLLEDHSYVNDGLILKIKAHETCLNNEVEIIEEQPKTIEKIDYRKYTSNDKAKIIDERGITHNIRSVDILFIEKINWLIDKVSEKDE